MNLLDIGRHGVVVAAARPAPSANAERDEAGRLHALLTRLGAEIAGPLTAALERINALSSTGKIDPESLSRLRDEVQAARQAGMIGQQLTRFAGGRIRQSHERLSLAGAVEHVLAHRQRQTRARGTRFDTRLTPVDVICDASLLASLLDSTFDWAIANAASDIELAIRIRPGTALAVFSCRYQALPADGLTKSLASGSNESLTWHLIQETARAMGLRIERSSNRQSGDAGADVQLSIEFPRTVFNDSNGTGQPKGSTDFGIDDGFAASANSQPLAGSHVLVIASRRDMRVAIREALRRMSLIVDFVNSVDEAAAFCSEGLPHAVVIEAIQNGERFAQFSREIWAELPDFAFIEIVEEGKVFELAGGPGPSISRVGREVLANSLPSALMFELSKCL